MGDTKGTENNNCFEGTSSWFITEAECDQMDSLEDLFETSTGDESILSQLIDDDPVEQGNSLALFNEQFSDACEAAVTALKRKLLPSPEQTISAQLSPKLAAINISPARKSKRRLFDSGIQEDETSDIHEKVVLDSIDKEIIDKDTIESTVDTGERDVLNVSNVKATLYAKFKEKYGVSFADLTRPFKSDKTCSIHWVASVYRAAETVLEASTELLKQYCSYVLLCTVASSGLYVMQFNATKNRGTVAKLLSRLLNVNVKLIMCEPPRTRSVPAAMYIYKRSLSNCCKSFGTLPDWIANLTLLNHQTATTAEAFDFSTMVQWAYDNHKNSEASIAYEYAKLANEDRNAAAFLKSSSQVKYVKDCLIMVRYYRRHEMNSMTMNEWIVKCCEDCEEVGNWKLIAEFLKYQDITLISFLTTLKTWFKGIPKKNCLVIYGDPDTGKSYFASSLVNFLKGSVLSFMNRQSQFWLQPVLDAKIAYIDDATYPAWQYIDVNMRNALDGNSISVDAKHKAPTQIKLPPLIITTNIDVKADMSLKYLHSRIICYKFPNPMPFDDEGNLMFNISHSTWNAFFRKLAVHLDLKEDFEHGGEESEQEFRCCAGPNTQSV